MTFVNIFSGKKTFILENLNSFKNLQNKEYKKNYNFFVFWDDDIMSKEEEKLLKQNLNYYHYKKININSFKIKYAKEFNKINSNDKFDKNEKNIFIKWLHQYYILNEAFKYARSKLGKKSENYIWQRIRTDIYVPSQIKFDEILKNEKILTLPGAKFGFGLNDYHCIGDYKNFKNYCDTINLLRFLLKNSIFMPPEVVINTQLIKTRTKFTINRSFPTNLIGKKDNQIFLRALYSREKGSRYISVNYSNYISAKNYKNVSDKLFISLLRRFIYIFVDLYQQSKIFIINTTK